MLQFALGPNAIAFNTQDRLARLYDTNLTHAECFGFRLKSSLSIKVAGIITIL